MKVGSSSGLRLGRSASETDKTKSSDTSKGTDFRRSRELASEKLKDISEETVKCISYINYTVFVIPCYFGSRP